MLNDAAFNELLTCYPIFHQASVLLQNDLRKMGSCTEFPDHDIVFDLESACSASDAIGNYATETISVQIGSTANPILRSNSIDMSAKVRRGTVNVTGKVSVVDQDGKAVRSAFSRTAYSNRKGVAKFTTSGDRGTYTLTVTYITKSDYDFDAANSALSNSLTR